MGRTKRVIAIGDLHAGHLAGLTPPRWQIPITEDERTKRQKYARLQRETWHEYDRLLKELAPIDRTLFLGDADDGKGTRSGGTEQITCDMEEQSDMAAAALNHIRLYAARGYKIVGVYGTPYHTSGAGGEDWENMVADKAGFAKIGAHEWPEINGCVFDLKHEIGSSTIPHGRHTSTARDMLWNDLWAASEEQPRASVVLRGHVHYFQFCGTPDKLGMTLPALQAMGTKYGSRRCSGIVHWGMVHFDVASDGAIEDWRAHVVKIRTQVAKVTVL